jgi:hypothetical protein
MSGILAARPFKQPHTKVYGRLGVRKQDWLSWPADVFDRDLLAFR